MRKSSVPIAKSFGPGPIRVLIHIPVDEKRLLPLAKRKGVRITYLTNEFRKSFGDIIPRTPTRIGFLDTYRCVRKAGRTEAYKEHLRLLIELIKKEKIETALLPLFLTKDAVDSIKRLGVTTALKVTDDPEISRYSTKHVVSFYDKVICSGVYYNKKRTISEMIEVWGAKDVTFLPVIISPEHYDNKPIDYERKDIDIIHIGALCMKKWYRLYRVQKVFKHKLQLYGHYDPRTTKGVVGSFYRLLNFFLPLPQVKSVSHKELKELYKRAKIGYNCHLSYGPSNARSYELCLNGVLQITDNPKGYQKLFSIGKEIICYKNTDEAIKYIKYYLSNKKNRERIAKAGYKRAIKDYSYEAIWKKHIEYLLSSQ